MAKSIPRKELLRDADPLEDFLLTALDFIKEHWMKLLIGGGALLAVIIGVSAFRHETERTRNEIASVFSGAQDSYTEASTGQSLTPPAQGASPEDSQLTPEQMRVAYEDALNGYQTIVNEHPGSYAYEMSLYKMGKAAYFLERYSEAVGHFERYKNEFPDGAFVLGATLGIAACNEMDNRPDAAITILRDFLGSAKPIHVPPVKMDLARLQREQGNLQAAKTLLDEIVTLGADSAYYATAKEQRDDVYRELGLEIPAEETPAAPM